ncbi:MAG: precorrin-4 C(11)-methyltransferase [Nitrospirota bacterium]|nr:precorrin-4 C(11)-methyltransferase [Nitrospirota bacterium]
MVHFIGAGPGNPELITVKGARLIEEADVVIYAGSLVNRQVIDAYARPEAAIHNSASMNLEEMVQVMAEGVRAGKKVVRVHTGDPSLYGAIGEQMEELEKLGIPYTVVPGVSSAFAASAALGIEYTIPEVTQTVILTRMAGRTPVPDSERIAELAKHGSTMVVFLTTQAIEELVTELLKGQYTTETPVAVVEKASWPEERIVRGTLANIAEKVKEAGIRKTALIIVGEATGRKGGEKSKLYDREFTHEYRS